MIIEAALITVSCVLFVQMGLADAFQEAMRIRSRIVSCQKCLSFWVCLAWTIIHGYGLVVSVAVSFIASYCALWLSLLYDCLALIYNQLYEQITQTNDTSTDAERPRSSSDTQAGCNEVSQMPE